MKSESHVGSCASAPAQLAEPGGAWWSLVEPGGAIVPRWRLAPVMAVWHDTIDRESPETLPEFEVYI